MVTYLLVNVVFILVAILVFRVQLHRPSRATLVTLVSLVILTAIFDSFIVGFGMVGYDSDKILGMYIGNAPIEDFFYAILAVILVPKLWQLLEKKHVK